METVNKKEELCICGHPNKKHRRNGRCTKCGCKQFTTAPHPDTCRCEVCAWKRIMELERQNRMNKQIMAEQRSLIDRLSFFISKTFAITPEDLAEVEEIRKQEEAAAKKQKPVQPKAPAPKTPP